MKMQTVKSVFAAMVVPTAMIMTCACHERLAVESQATLNNKAEEIGQWEAQGWKYEETVGEEIPEATSAVHLSSDSARVIGAVAKREDGETIEKGFPQDDKLFLVVTMSGGERGTYCLVFSKQKPADTSE